MQLEDHPFFRIFPAEKAKELRRLARIRRFPTNRLIFAENSPAESLHLLLEGSVSLVKTLPEGAYQVLAKAVPGDYFGDFGVLDGSGRSAGAVAATPAVTASIPREPFIRILRSSPWEATLHLCLRLIENLRQTNETYMWEVVHKEKITLVGEMANAIIHDFKTPMTSIHFALDRIRGQHEDEATRQSLDLMARQIRRMNTMMEEILEFSRGVPILNLVPVSLGPLFENIRHTHENRLRDRKADLEIMPTKASVRGDADRLERVLQNLVSNAIDALPKSRPGKINIGARRRGRGKIDITVSDNGRGVPASIRDRIFHPFVTHGKRGGTGLGLAICKGIVDAHGGAISFTTGRGAGTTFRIRLPAA